MNCKLTNTEVLMFIVGWQGGTIHQLAEHLGVPQDNILNGDYNMMQELMRLAQTKNIHLESANTAQRTIAADWHEMKALMAERDELREALNIGAIDFCNRAGFDVDTATQRVSDWILTARNRQEAAK